MKQAVAVCESKWVNIGIDFAQIDDEQFALLMGCLRILEEAGVRCPMLIDKDPARWTRRKVA